ncbi:hypothetical protein N7492_004726 [Penicillium capsulatum]|uniref:Uncharacterized protein n=1 Tax=Penicillium capsulatum TaxID=69766 RepID=A0A9W9LRG1_9EURO|nr:hypothetical protein N7492_004726 [Penicillium capsulatum]
MTRSRRGNRDQPPSKRRRTEATSQSSLLSGNHSVRPDITGLKSTAASDRSDEVQVHNGILSMSTMDILRGQEYNPTNKTYTSPSAPAPPGESATQAQYARAIFARMAFELLELPTEMLEQLLGYLQAEIGRRSQQ